MDGEVKEALDELSVEYQNSVLEVDKQLFKVSQNGEKCVKERHLGLSSHDHSLGTRTD